MHSTLWKYSTWWIHLFPACYRAVGRKKLLQKINLWFHQLVAMFVLIKDPLTKSLSDEQIKRNINKAFSKLLALSIPYSAYQLLLKENKTMNTRDGSRDFEKGWCSMSARWSKKAKITLETLNFLQIFLSAFSIFFYFYIQWKRANEFLSKFANPLVRKDKRHLCNHNEKKKLRKIGFGFMTGCFI